MSAWGPAATLEAVRLRAELNRRLRAFFEARGVLEVETPILSAAAIPDPALESLSCRYTGPGHADGLSLYLHTSPEFPMKRLLAAGSGPIYQLCKVFRQGEAGSRHNPEFSMLEWYRPGFGMKALMAEVDELVRELLRGTLEPGETELLSYAAAFQRYLGVDPFAASIDELAACARTEGINAPPLEGRDEWLDLLLVERIEPELGRGRLTFLYGYPASQAALARISPEDPRQAERFELYCEGLELANGFHELTDAAEQRRRFEAENAERQARGMAPVPLDEQLLAALEVGMPDCSGVALGLDRLLMLAWAGAQGEAHPVAIDQVLAFPLERA